MKFKTIRQKRYDVLCFTGFTGFEARTLSRVPFRVPYILPLIKEREAEYTRAAKRAKRQDLSKTAFEKKWLNFIKRRYIMKGWRYRGEPWGATVTFRMVKDKEFDYKRKHPEYESPWEKRRKQFKDFLAKIERVYDEKYPKGYGKEWADKELRYLPGGGAELVDKE